MALTPVVAARAVQEGETVGVGTGERRPGNDASAAARFAAVVERAGDRRMRTVGRDEVDDRLFVLQVTREIDPARVGRKLRVAGHGVELGARLR